MTPAQTEKEETVGASDRRSPAVRYGLAVVAVGLAAAAKLLVDPALEAESPFLLFVVAIVVGAWFGGLGPGLFATGIALLLCDYLFFGPPYSFGIDGPGRLFDLTLFGGVGAAVSALVASMHAARLRSVASERRFRLLVQGAKDYAIFMLSPDGRVTSWNEGARRILGYEEGEILGEHFSVFFTPEDRREGRPEREFGLAIDGVTVSEETWAVRRDGSRLWANGSMEAVRDGEGSLEGVVKVLRDRTEARRAEEELRLKDRALTASANGIVITDPNLPDNPIVYANPAFTKMTGYTPEEAVGRNCRFLQGEDHDQPELEELRAAIRAGETCEVVLRNYRKDGALFYNELTVSPVFDDGGRIVRFVGIQDDITEQRRAEDALRVQAEASEILATPLAYEERLVSLARLVVPRLADWCAVDVVEENGPVRRLAVEHQDPEKVALAYELQRRYPSRADAPQGVPRVLKTGEPEMMEEIPDELLAQSVRDERQLGMLRELGLRSYMIVPMIARGRTLGAITLVSAESGRHYGPEDLEQAQILVRRAAMVVDNARLYEEARREIAERQRAQEELRQSEDRLRLATEATRLGTFDYDPVTGELLWDVRCKEIFGLPPDAGVNYETFLAGLHPDDRVVVTDATGATDSVFVDDVSIDPGGPVDTDPANALAPVVLEGRASYADGTPIPADQLDSGELRQDAVRLRAAPTSVEKIEGTTDRWRATYRYPYTLLKPSSLGPQQQKNAILSGAHAMGYGHAELPPPETQIAEHPAGGGPALDCGNPASPFYAPKSANAVATADDAVNLAGATSRSAVRQPVMLPL